MARTLLNAAGSHHSGPPSNKASHARAHMCMHAHTHTSMSILRWHARCSMPQAPITQAPLPIKPHMHELTCACTHTHTHTHTHTSMCILRWHAHCSMPQAPITQAPLAIKPHMHELTCACTHAHTHTHTHTHKHKQTRTRTHTHIHVYTEMARTHARCSMPQAPITQAPLAIVASITILSSAVHSWEEPVTTAAETNA